MIYLILSILMSSTLALILKIASAKHANKHAVTSLNYVAASTTMLVMSVMEGIFEIDRSGSPGFWAQIGSCLKNNTLLDPQGSWVWAIGLGIITGFMYYGSFILYQKCIDEKGSAIAVAFGKMGTIFPLVLSLVLWKQIPSVFQIVAIILAIVATLMMNFKLDESMKNIGWLIPAYIIISGMGQFLNKVFQQYGMIEFKTFYLFFTFFTALCTSLYCFIKHEGYKDKKAMLMGLLAGFPNCFCSVFLVLSLVTVNAAVVYPMYTAGTVAVAALIGLVGFKEKIGKRGYWALFLIFIASILINLS